MACVASRVPSSGVFDIWPLERYFVRPGVPSSGPNALHQQPNASLHRIGRPLRVSLAALRGCRRPPDHRDQHLWWAGGIDRG
eukprot:8251808-Alexandrium_andersonii.AAC.1